MKKTFILISLFLSFKPYVNAQSMDPEFGTNGITVTNIGSSYDHIYSMALQNDGKLVAAGVSKINGQFDYAIARYSNGILDKSFSDDGKLTDSFGDADDGLTSVIIQKDDKIVVAGYSFNNNIKDMIVARYNSNGTLDKSFSNDGKTIIDFGKLNEQANALALQTDGKILIAGFCSDIYPHRGDFALARINKDGTPDKTFGTNGLVTTSFGYGLDKANAIVVQTDGKILLAGSGYVAQHGEIGLVRYNPDGSLDTTFGNGGLVYRIWGSDAEAKSVLLKNEGKILIGGLIYMPHIDPMDEDPTYRYDGMMIQYNMNGNLDTNFGNKGVAFDYDYNDPLGSGMINSIILQPTGKIIAAGGKDFQMKRFNPYGYNDKGFGNNGSSHYGGHYVTAMVRQTDGKIILGGGSDVNSQKSFVVGRYIIDEALGINDPELKTNSVLLYPNPNNGKFTLEIDKPAKDISIEVYNLWGNLVKIIETPAAETSYSIDLGVAKGIYLVRIINGEMLINKKVLVH